jgi:phosphatidylserine/phosphatidylglycerophosphate/cardiolipin synthase-like enzyme
LPATYDVGAGARPFNPPKPAALPPAPAAPRPPIGPPAPGAAGTAVQVVRSWPDTKEFRGFLAAGVPWRTLPATGVHEVRSTLLAAIAGARRYVYLEDQAFDAERTLLPELARACRRGVKVIAVLPGSTDPNDGTLAAANQQLGPAVRTALLGLLGAAQQENLAVWRLTDVMVHAKVVLVDDAFLCVGSANAMDRSLQETASGDDSELSVAAVSTTSLVADLRVRLWAEHLRVGTAPALAEVRDLDASLGFWRRGWGRGLREPHPGTPLAFVGPAGTGTGAVPKQRAEVLAGG